jgi:hypothetical protein
MGYTPTFDNRHYVVPEVLFGNVNVPSDAERIPLVCMELTHAFHVPKRKDKTGSRTNSGNSAALRHAGHFLIRGYLYENPAFPSPPACASLLEAALGGSLRVFSGATVDSALTPTRIRFQSVHSLTAGQGLAFGGEIRFVTVVTDFQTVEINAPFSTLVTSGTELGPTITFSLGSDIRSLSLFDYWGGAGVHRVACGAVVDNMKLSLNGDFHELEFEGPAARVVDSASFVTGVGGMAVFPDEPASQPIRLNPVPGHLGQVWLGGGPIYTLTEGTLRITNNVVMRNREFGSSTARLAVPGERSVSFKFSMLQDDMDKAGELCAAARNRLPIPVMLQLGQQSSQLMGIYLKSVIPQLPTYGDSDSRLQFIFENCVANGTADDELFIAIG